MKTQASRQKSEAELQQLLREKREVLRKFYFNLGSGKMKNTKEARQLRRDIARILTIIKQK
jgi:large subunit ribosomal protein L29